MSSIGTASNNRLKNDKLIKVQTVESNNPDFHNIYEEDLSNNNILITESNIIVDKISNICNNTTNQDQVFSQDKNNISISNNLDIKKPNYIINETNNYNVNKISNSELKNNQNLNSDYLNTENTNKYCVTEVNMNFTETDHQNNILITEMDNLITRDCQNEKNFNNLDTIVSDDVNNRELNNKIKNNLKINNEENQNFNYVNQIAETEADKSAIPEYLPTEINNVLTSSQGNYNILLLNDTYNNIVNNTSKDNNLTSNENNNIYNFIKNNIIDSNNKEKLEKNINNTNNYCNYICQTELDGDIRNTENKNEPNFLNSSQNYEINNINTNNNDNISIDLIANYPQKISIKNIRNYENEDSIIYNNQDDIDKKNSKNVESNNKDNNLEMIELKSNTPEIKKKVNFEIEKYSDKYKHSIINSYDNKIKNTQKNNYQKLAYKENVLNTDSNIKKDTLNNFYTKNTKTTKNDYKQYLGRLMQTKADKFKKGFFNTSVSYDKTIDIRNKTFDGKMNESSLSKSREKSPLYNNIKTNFIKKDILNRTKNGFNNKDDDLKKARLQGFLTNKISNSNKNSQSKSKGKNEINNIILNQKKIYNSNTKTYKKTSPVIDEVSRIEKSRKTDNFKNNISDSISRNDPINKYKYAYRFM